MCTLNACSQGQWGSVKGGTQWCRLIPLLSDWCNPMSCIKVGQAVADSSLSEKHSCKLDGLRNSERKNRRRENLGESKRCTDSLSMNFCPRFCYLFKTTIRWNLHNTSSCDTVHHSIIVLHNKLLYTTLNYWIITVNNEESQQGFKMMCIKRYSCVSQLA